MRGGSGRSGSVHVRERLRSMIKINNFFKSERRGFPGNRREKNETNQKNQTPLASGSAS